MPSSRSVVRRIHLLRHAKSSWDEPSTPDQDRPLAPRGRKAAKRLARHLRESDIRPNLVLCSSARRARQTLELIENGLPDDVEIEIEPDLYGASADALLERLRALPPEVRAVMLIGHNPGLQDLGLMLAGSGDALPRLREHYPTLALASLQVRSSTWKTLAGGSATLTGLLVPADLG
jgi:phosphohistidine phosphatase